LLLAALDPCVVHGDRQRRRHLYGRGQVFGSPLRHLRGVAPVEVPLLARRVVGATGRGSLVPLAAGGHQSLSSAHGAPPPAVLVPVVAEAAQEEELPAAPAEDKAKRVHGSGRDRQELDADPKPCDELLVAPGSGSAA
jgi:hypothetical protein